MLSFLKPRMPIDSDELEWQFATFKWLIREFGGVEGQLVLPTSDWFPASTLKGDARIRQLFELVKRAAGMESWECELQPGDSDRPIHAGNSLLIAHEGAAAPCGTFQVAGAGGERRVVITYNPGLAADTTAMIATFAHELGHYLMSTAASDPPGGWGLHELHTDIAAVYLGFGLFLANSARSYRQYQDTVEAGWSSRLQGYLSEDSLVTALAIYQRLSGSEMLAADRYLKDYLRPQLRRADKALRRLHPDLFAAIEGVDLSQFAADGG